MRVVRIAEIKSSPLLSSRVGGGSVTSGGCSSPCCLDMSRDLTRRHLVSLNSSRLGEAPSPKLYREIYKGEERVAKGESAAKKQNNLF